MARGTKFFVGRILFAIVVKTYSILLTNDDGVDSPSLVPTIEAILRVPLEIDLRVVVPDGERSWISKKISRFETLYHTDVEIAGYSVTTLNGTPADCVNFGIYNFTPKPDLVVSGCNVGGNISLGHYLSSGTIGGMLEGVIAHIPSIAVSSPYHTEPLITESFATAMSDLHELILQFILHPPVFLGMSVNIPLTKLSPLYYGVFLSPRSYKAIFTRLPDSNELGFASYRYNYEPEECIKGTDRWSISLGIPCVVGVGEYAFPIDQKEVIAWLESVNLLLT